MLINAQPRSKQEEIQPVRCDVACIVELSNAEFFRLPIQPLADHDFIKEHLPDLKTDEFHAIPCILVLGESVDDGILVDPQGMTMPATPHISRWHGSSFKTSSLKVRMALSRKKIRKKIPSRVDDVEVMSYGTWKDEIGVRNL